MRRLVPLPLNQIRPRFLLHRDRFNRALFLRSSYLLALFLGAVLVPTYMFFRSFRLIPVGFAVDLPQPLNGKDCSPGIPMHLIFVQEPGRFLFDGSPTGPGELESHFRKAVASAPIPVVYVEGANDLPAQAVLGAIDAIKGIDPKVHVALLTPKMRAEPCLLLRLRSYP